MNRTLEAAAGDGRVETILGRRRAINGIKNTTGRNLNLAERTAVNAVIQGSAADLIKRAMLEVDRRIRAEGLRARMLLQIHDELVFEAPDEEVARAGRAGPRGDGRRDRLRRADPGRRRRRPELARRRPRPARIGSDRRRAGADAGKMSDRAGDSDCRRAPAVV